MILYLNHILHEIYEYPTIGYNGSLLLPEDDFFIKQIYNQSID